VSVSGIGLLSELQYLDLTQNKLDYLPDDICQLVKLKELKVAKNNLTARSIPTDLFTAPISLLDLSENKLTKLPLDLVYELCKLSTVLLHGNNWSAPELQRITSNSPQEDIKLVLTIYTETMAKNATMPVETREQGEKKKTIAENVGGFLARKLSIGKGNPKKSEEPESVPEPKILKPKATKQDNADEVEAFIAPAPEPKPKPVRVASAKSDPVEEPESNSEPKILKPPKLAKGDQKSGSKSNSLDTAAESPSEKVSLSSATSPRSPGTIAPVLVQDPVKLPERTAAPLKQHSRAAGPKGRKPPSAEFISQNIQEEVVIAKGILFLCRFNSNESNRSQGSGNIQSRTCYTRRNS
jgi:hypothetical protein